MGLISVPVDPLPARVKIDLQLHQPYRTWFGLGQVKCEWCGEAWGRHGCSFRASAARLFLYTATAAQRTAALDSGDITADDLELRRRTPARHRRHHRRKPSPYPRPDGPPNPLAALRLTELAVALR